MGGPVGHVVKQSHQREFMGKGDGQQSIPIITSDTYHQPVTKTGVEFICMHETARDLLL
jgi:hypothetical protein